MFRIAKLSRPYLVPYMSYAGQDKSLVSLSNNYDQVIVRMTKSSVGRPISSTYGPGTTN